MPFGSLAGAAGPRRAGLCEPSGRLSRRPGCCSASRWPPRSTIRPSRRSGAFSAPRARQPITALTLVGGFASTVSWPATFALLQSDRLAGHVSRLRGAARLRGGAAARLRAAAHARRRRRRPRESASAAAAAAGRRGRGVPARRWRRSRLTPSCPSGLSAHLLAIFQRAGIEPGTVVVDRRAVRSLAGRRAAVRIHLRAQRPPAHGSRASRSACWCVRSRCCGLFGFSTPVAVLFAIMFGVANGLITIARGAVPLALFGAGRLRPASSAASPDPR